MEPDVSLRQQTVTTGVGGGGRSKLSLRRKKDKDASTHQQRLPRPSTPPPPAPPPNPTNLSLRITPCDILTVITPKSSKTTSTTHTHSGDSESDNFDDASIHHDKTPPPSCMKKLTLASTSDDVEYLSVDEERKVEVDIDERTEMVHVLQHASSSRPADIDIDKDDDDNDDDDVGLGRFYFCHICQKDLTRFTKSRRQTHINRCCDKQEEEKEESLAAAAAKEGQSSTFACLLCKKTFKSDNARMTHMKSCAKSKGVAPDRLVQMMRESKKTTTSSAVTDGAASSGVQESSSSSSRMEGGEGGEGERGEPFQARRSKRLVGQSGKGGKQSKGVDATTILSREDEDFAVPPPVSRPTGRRGRKRKRDNLQDDYLEELEKEQLRLAMALSASMEGGGNVVYEGESSHDDQRKGRKRQKRKNAAAAELVPPLLTVDTKQAENIINQRAEEILRRSETAANNTNTGPGGLEPGADDDDIPCTPAFQESELGGRRGNSCKYNMPDGLMKPGATAVTDGQEGSGDENNDEVVVLLDDNGDEKLLEIDAESAVKPRGGDTSPADDDASTKSTNEVHVLSTGEGKMAEPVQADGVTKSVEKVVIEDNEVMSLGDESERSELEDTPLHVHVAMETGATAEHGVSFHEDLQEVDYPTLWQLTAEESHSVEHFYVPALIPVVSPVKAEQNRCKECEVEPCLAMTLQAVPTIPMEDQYWQEEINVSPVQQTINSSKVTRDHSAIDRLLSDLGSLVGLSHFSDVEIRTGTGSIIPAHACILAARCQKLRQAIQQSQTTPISLDFSSFDDDTILAFLHFIYTGSSPPETDDNVRLVHDFSLLVERWYGSDEQHSEKKDGESFPRIKKKSPVSGLETHTDVSNSPLAGVHHTSVTSNTEQLSPSVKKVGSSDHFTNDHLTSRSGHHASNSSSPELERDSSLRRTRKKSEEEEKEEKEEERAGESVRHHSSSEWSHQSSHISLSSVDSDEVVICKTPTALLSPGGERGGEGEDSLSTTTSGLFHPPSLDHYYSRSENGCINGGEREGGAVESGERTVESILVESSSSSSRSSSVVPLASPHSLCLTEKQEKASPDDRLPGSSASRVPKMIIPDVSVSNISIPDVETPDISVPNVTTPDFSLPDFTPIDDYSFGAFDDDIISTSFEQAPVEPVEPVGPGSLKLVTPVTDRTVTMVPESNDTVKRKPQCFKTPASCGVELQTDDDITPMPDFKSMRTPCLKGECARFGVKPLPKKKMIAKLSEIYEHTHPLVDAEGRIISESQEDGSSTKTTKQGPADKNKTKAKAAGRAKKAGAVEGGARQKTAAAQGCSIHELKMAVLEYFKSDKQLYQDILLFKPMELSYFCTKMKSAGISVAKEKLADILDNLCITYTVPRTSKKVIS